MYERTLGDGIGIRWSAARRDRTVEVPAPARLHAQRELHGSLVFGLLGLGSGPRGRDHGLVSSAVMITPNERASSWQRCGVPDVDNIVASAFAFSCIYGRVWAFGRRREV